MADRGDSEELRRIARTAADAFDESKNISVVGNPVVDAILSHYLLIAKENRMKVTLDVAIPEVLPVSPLSLSILIGNTMDNAIEACRSLPQPAAGTAPHSFAAAQAIPDPVLPP